MKRFTLKIWHLYFSFLSFDNYIPTYVPCKYKMGIFKIALVINDIVHFAFPYVLSIHRTNKAAI